MAQLAKETITPAGLNPTFNAAAGGGDTFEPGDDTYLHVKNGSGGSLTVTIDTPGSDELGLAEANVAVAVPAGDERIIGPFPPRHFENPSDHLAHINYSGVTSLTVAVLELRPLH